MKKIIVKVTSKKDIDNAPKKGAIVLKPVNSEMRKLVWDYLTNHLKK